MRRAAGVLMMMTVMVIVVAPAQARTHVTCRSGRTVQANAKARVFWVGHRLYACASRARKPLLLYEESVPCPADSSSGCDAVDGVRLASRYVAVAWEVQQRDGTSSAAVVFDVIARKRVRARYTPQQSGWSYGIADLEVTTHGGLGVIEVAQYAGLYPTPPTYEVRKQDANGSAVLDSGPDIDPSSLALSTGTLYWTRGGEAHSAPIH
jgi:hypothetical protein